MSRSPHHGQIREKVGVIWKDLDSVQFLTIRYQAVRRLNRKRAPRYLAVSIEQPTSFRTTAGECVPHSWRPICQYRIRPTRKVIGNP